MNTVQLIDLVPEGGWLTPESPRIAPVQDSELSLKKRTALRVMLKVGKARCPNLFRTMFRNFRVYLPFARFNAKVMPKGQLSRRHTELAILRVGWKMRSYYEWGQHVDIGLRIGLSPADIYRVTLGPGEEGWGDEERAILLAVDNIIDDKVVDAKTWGALTPHFNDHLLIELIFLITSYSGLATVLNSVGVQLEPEVEEVVSGLAVCY